LYREPTIDNLKKMMSVFVFDASSLTEELYQARLTNMLSNREHLDNFVEPGRQPQAVSRLRARAWARVHRLLWSSGAATTASCPWMWACVCCGACRDAELHIFNRCGHWAQWEHADKFNRMVLDFLAQ
jgi:2-hydroxy-6-oxonona-2,4-dienedioate hydrolase